MWLRNVTMTMAILCFMLTAIFALTHLIYDFDRWIDVAIHFFIFGSMYSFAVLFMALFHDIMDRPRFMLRLSFWLAFFPTAFYFYALGVMAFG